MCPISRETGHSVRAEAKFPVDVITKSKSRDRDAKDPEAERARLVCIRF